MGYLGMGWNLATQGHGEALGGAEVSQGEYVEREDWWASLYLIWYLPDRPRASFMEPPASYKPYLWTT